MHRRSMVHCMQHLHGGESVWHLREKCTAWQYICQLQQAEEVLCCEGPAPEGFPPDLPAPEALTPADAKDAEPLMPLVSILSCKLLPDHGGPAASTETKI